MCALGAPHAVALLLQMWLALELWKEQEMGTGSGQSIGTKYGVAHVWAGWAPVCWGMGEQKIMHTAFGKIPLCVHVCV